MAERIAEVRGSRIECYGSLDLLLRSQRRQGFERGRAEGRAEMVRQILLSRGIEVSKRFPAAAAAFSAASEGVLISAALACTDEADFLAALS